MSDRNRDNTPPISLEDLLKAYALGYFPMADARDDPRLFWVAPEWRGVLPLDSVHIPRRLKRTIRQDVYQVRVDTAFRAVMENCAAERENRRETWINTPILELYTGLHEMGFAHSVECWDGERLVGGLYGVALGGAFFGESMFTLATDASKVALIHLVGRLKAGGFALLDTQFHTDHLGQFGVVEIAKDDYLEQLEEAVYASADFYSLSGISAPVATSVPIGAAVSGAGSAAPVPGAAILQSITQTS